jgi:subtilisin family serine protease
LGGSVYSATLANSINNAIAKGVIFVTITHNDGTGTIRFPGSLESAITVGATDKGDLRCGFSNYGSMIDLVAPGTNINSVGKSGALQAWWGTSFAAPQVAGVCSLLAAVRPQITHEEARNLLCAGADDRVGDVADAPGFDPYYGWGRLNAFNSILLARTRIDRIQMVSTNIVLSWPSPPNAQGKQPFVVESSTGVKGSWIPVTTIGRFSYQTNRTYWTAPHSASAQPAKVYRVRIRTF